MKQQLVPDPFGAGLSAPVPRPGPLAQWVAQRQAQPPPTPLSLMQALRPIAGMVAAPIGGSPIPMAAGYAGAKGTLEGALDAGRLWTGVANGSIVPDSQDPNFVGRVFNTAGMVTVGSGAFGGAPGELGMGIRAYHGSPHDFDQFRMDKLGTGEGSQVYGHGLYFAENPAVAEHYRTALSRQELRHPDFGTVEPGEMNLMIADAARQASPSLDPTLHEQITSRVSDILAGFSNESLDDVRQAVVRYGAAAPQEQRAWLGALNRAQEFQRAPAGKVYEVDIDADPNRLLDWDQHLTDQPAPVREGLKQLMPDYAPYMQPMEEWDRRVLDNYLEAGGSPLRGDSAYYALAQSQAPGKAGEVAASQALRESGIPGIRFLDQGSRGQGQGTHNLVIFDDSIIKILRKYGIAGLAILPPATAAAVRQYMEPVDNDPFAE